MRRALLLVLALLAACAGAPRISLEAGPAPPALERSFARFWDAALAFDLESAEALASGPGERLYLQALRAIAADRLAEALGLLSGLVQSEDATLAARSKALLAGIVKEGPYLPANAFTSQVDRSFAEALLEARAKEKWRFPAGTVALPFERRGSPTPIVPIGVNGKHATLGLDTGAGLTVIGSELAAAVGAKRTGARTGARDAHGEEVRVELAVVDLQVGAIVIERHPVIVIDSARLRFSVAGIEIAGFDGVLGWNAIRGLRVVVDNPAGVVRFGPSANRIAPPRDLFWIGEPYVRARAANGFPLRLFLDTGASRSALAMPLAADSGLRDGEIRSTLVMGAGSSRRTEVTVFRDAALQVGGARVSFGELQGIEPRATGYSVRDGVLGADVLSEGRVTIDFGSGEFSIEPAR